MRQPNRGSFVPFNAGINHQVIKPVSKLAHLTPLQFCKVLFDSCGKSCKRETHAKSLAKLVKFTYVPKQQGIQENCGFPLGVPLNQNIKKTSKAVEHLPTVNAGGAKPNATSRMDSAVGSGGCTTRKVVKPFGRFPLSSPQK